MAAHWVLRKQPNATVLKIYYTYILLSLKDGRYYFGYTDNLENRLKRHNSGGVASTRNRIPFILHYSESFTEKQAAIKRELFFKSFEGRKWLIENNIIKPKS